MAGSGNAKTVRLNMIDGCPRRSQEAYLGALPTFDMYFSFPEDPAYCHENPGRKTKKKGSKRESREDKDLSEYESAEEEPEEGRAPKSPKRY